MRTVFLLLVCAGCATAPSPEFDELKFLELRLDEISDGINTLEHEVDALQQEVQQQKCPGEDASP